MKQFIAITCTGKEYTYYRDSMHLVPASSAARIRSALNSARYCLRPGETWHLYTSEDFDLDYIWKKFYIRSGKIWEGTV